MSDTLNNSLDNTFVLSDDELELYEDGDGLCVEVSGPVVTLNLRLPYQVSS